MRAFRSIATVHAALVAALGLSAFACGGATLTTGTESPDGGKPDAGPTSSCVDPTPIVVQGKDTGFDQCKGGPRRRRAAVDCPQPVRTNGGACNAGTNGVRQCASDSDCTTYPYGTCGTSTGDIGPGCFCFYGCVRDSDCNAGEICSCSASGGTCEAATCTTSDACGNGECAEYTASPGCPSEAFACQAKGDACFGDADCPSGEMCTIQGTARACSRPMCAVGRPFVVEGEARLAPVATRADWRAAIAPADAMDETTRARLANAWTQIGRMEHASVAAFARLALQLLAVGAPPDLVMAAQEAMGDETTHARLAFGLASAYAGADVGPGPLAIDACLDGCDLEALVATTVREGCVGETVAAIEAREALAHARDPEVRAVLATIARDETRHAELAWRTIAWALEVGGARARAALERALAEAAEESEAGAEGAGLLAHGIVSDALRGELRRAAIAQVVLPCAAALVARDGSRAQRDAALRA